MLISARHDDRPRHQIGVIGDQDTAFARVNHLVGLEGKTADLANRPDFPPPPKRAQRMGRVFDHRHASGLAKPHDRIHIRSMPPHMADDHRPNARQFGGEILQIHTVILAHLTKHRLAACVDHCRRHGSKGETRDQHRRPIRQVQSKQGQKQRGRAGGHGQRIFTAHHLRKFDLQQGNRRVLGRSIAKKIATLQKLRNGGLRFGRDRFGTVHVGQSHISKS